MTFGNRDTDEEWKEQANCAKLHLSLRAVYEIFFDDKYEVQKIAKSICATCPVKGKCLRYAVDNKIDYGIWGGMSARDRRRMKSVPNSTRV